MARTVSLAGAAADTHTCVRAGSLPRRRGERQRSSHGRANGELSCQPSRRALLRWAGAVGAAAALPWQAGLAAQSTFRFIVVNDLHHGSRECDPLFGSLVQQMRSHGPVDFCIIGGDIADTGIPESFVAVREAFTALGAPIYTVPGNHDCDVEKSTRLYSEAFPERLNYAFRHHDWQFIALDTTEGIDLLEPESRQAAAAADRLWRLL